MRHCTCVSPRNIYHPLMHLFQHLQESERACEEDCSDSNSSTLTNESHHLAVDLQPEATHPAKGEALAYSPPNPSRLNGWELVCELTAGLPTCTTLHDPTSAWSSVSKHSRRHSSGTSSELLPESTSSSAKSSGSTRRQTATDTTDEVRGKRHQRCHRSTHGHSYPQVLASPFISCILTPDKREIQKIQKGKYVLFDKLLPLPGQVGQAAWMEAWNMFSATRIQKAPQTALEVVKYLPALHGVRDGSNPQVRNRLWLGTLR